MKLGSMATQTSKRTSVECISECLYPKMVHVYLSFYLSLVKGVEGAVRALFILPVPTPTLNNEIRLQKERTALALSASSLLFYFS
jgi:hypothetical protein